MYETEKKEEFSVKIIKQKLFRQNFFFQQFSSHKLEKTI